MHFQVTPAYNKTAEATGLISFVLGGHLQRGGWQLSFLLLHLVVGGHLIRRRHRQILQSGFKVLCELAPGCHSTRATDILKGPDNYLLWGTFLCIVGYFAALLASTH